MKEPDLATDFDIIILGAGSDSQAAVRQVRKRTERFLLINDGPYCTTCARVGCMPFKALIEVANARLSRHKSKAFGIHGSKHMSIDIAAVSDKVFVPRTQHHHRYQFEPGCATHPGRRCCSGTWR
jgi:dihydrolipoamide dehydrogenase